MKNFKRAYYILFIALSMALISCSSGKEFIPFGQPDVDRVRKEMMLFSEPDRLTFLLFWRLHRRQILNITI